jgi:hypothetical protein
MPVGPNREMNRTSEVAAASNVPAGCGLKTNRNENENSKKRKTHRKPPSENKTDIATSRSRK